MPRHALAEMFIAGQGERGDAEEDRVTSENRTPAGVSLVLAALRLMKDARRREDIERADAEQKGGRGGGDEKRLYNMRHKLAPAGNGDVDGAGAPADVPARRRPSRGKDYPA